MLLIFLFHCCCNNPKQIDVKIVHPEVVRVIAIRWTRLYIYIYNI